MIHLKVKLLKNLGEKSRGLIGYNAAFPVMIKTRFGIHTFGMSFPIDVLIISNEEKIVKISENLKPNKFFIWLPIYDTVIELPSGEIKKKGIKVGDKLTLELI